MCSVCVCYLQPVFGLRMSRDEFIQYSWIHHQLLDNGILYCLPDQLRIAHQLQFNITLDYNGILYCLPDQLQIAHQLQFNIKLDYNGILYCLPDQLWTAHQLQFNNHYTCIIATTPE